METLVNHINASSVNHELIRMTITKIRKFVEDNGYQFKDEKAFEELTESKFNAAFNDLSKKKRKRLASYIWAVNNHPSLGGINKFFHFLMKNIMKSDVRIRVIKSDKELAIEAKRKAYKKALEAMKTAYADYKTEKGDFYKIKLAKNQK